MALFGGAAAASQVRSRNLVEFKAGKMTLRDNMVYPDKRKGLVYLYQGNDLLMHLCWKDRSKEVPEDDLVIFPDEIEFKKVTQNTTGRVYVLKWKSNTRKFFFWMQEPKADKDEQFCKKINDLLNHPPAPAFDDDDGVGSGHPLQPFMERMVGGGGGGGGGLDSNDLGNILRGMDPNDLASLVHSFGRSRGGAAGLMQGLHRGHTNQQGSASSSSDASVPTGNRSNATRSAGTTSTANRNSGSSTAPRNDGASSPSSSAAAAATVPKTTTSSGSKTGSIQMSALTNVLANLSSNTASSNSAVALYDLIDSEILIPLLSNKDVQEKFRVYLPEGNLTLSSENELRESIQSPQFRQIVNAFSTALQSRELGPILTQSGFPDDVTKAASQGDLQAFAEALEKHSKSSDDPMDINE